MGKPFLVDWSLKDLKACPGGLFSMFKKVAIVGTGLIGGSLGLVIKKKRIAREVLGVSRHKSSLFIAKRIGAIDAGSLDLGIVKDADLIILAMPVNAILNLAEKISKACSKKAVVTDVGSTKQDVVKKLERIFPNFLGSHPLAGSEKRSVAHAEAGLFNGSLCILTPTKRTSRHALKSIKKFWKKIGVKTVDLSPEAHDKVLSLTSHLPHIAAFSLMESVPANYLKFASGGLRDTTRIAASEGELWADIFLSNRNNIISGIVLLEKNISRIKSALSSKDRRSLIKFLRSAKEKREKLQ